MVNDGGLAEWDQRNLFYVRVSDLLKVAHHYAINDQYDNYHDALSSVYKEIYGKLTKAEKKRLNELEENSAIWAKAGEKGNINTDKVLDNLNHFHKELSATLWRHGMVIQVSARQGSGMRDL